MKLPLQVKGILSRWEIRYPIPQIAATESPEQFEDRVRQWNLRRIAQIVYETPSSAGWGAKRADTNRPISKDAIAQVQQSMAFYAWDTLVGTGTGHPTPAMDPESIDITGQVFVPVKGVNFLGGDVPEPEPNPEPVPEPVPPTVIPYDEGYAVEFGMGCNDVYLESHAPIDSGMIAVHSQRAAWDYYVGGLSWNESYRKHLNEFRREYGLPPV